jgi:hypothetical protein
VKSACRFVELREAHFSIFEHRADFEPASWRIRETLASFVRRVDENARKNQQGG